MSVPSWQRNESSVQFLETYKQIRKQVNQILMRDFGLKPRSYDVKLVESIYSLTEEDKQTLENISEKYGMKTYAIKKYPEWMVADMRTGIRASIKGIGTHIEIANNIFIGDAGKDKGEDLNRRVREGLYIERRKQWSMAIGYCNALKDGLQEVLETFSVQKNQYEIVFGLIKKEIDLLKGVRKSDSRFL